MTTVFILGGVNLLAWGSLSFLNLREYENAKAHPCNCYQAILHNDWLIVLPLVFTLLAFAVPLFAWLFRNSANFSEPSRSYGGAVLGLMLMVLPFVLFFYGGGV